jgi:tripartite-type tricarboxylate transporter receptor subunit TctC
MTTAVRLVLGFSAGSASDQIARTIAPALSEALHRRIEIDLRPGSDGALAARHVADAAPDGNTLFMATLGTHALAPHLDPGLPYDPLADFAPVSLVSVAPLVLACHASVGARTPAELIAIAREKPGVITYGTSAIGGAPHLAAELFQSLAGVELKHVRYDETERLYDDLESGRVDSSFNNMMSMLPRCDGTRVVALAVTGARRSAAAEHLPTLAESGLPGYEVSNWLGIVAPKDTPSRVIDDTSRAIAAALATREVQALRASGVTPCGGTAAEFAGFMERELARWRGVVARFRDIHA